MWEEGKRRGWNEGKVDYENDKEKRKLKSSN